MGDSRGDYDSGVRNAIVSHRLGAACLSPECPADPRCPRGFSRGLFLFPFPAICPSWRAIPLPSRMEDGWKTLGRRKEDSDDESLPERLRGTLKPWVCRDPFTFREALILAVPLSVPLGFGRENAQVFRVNRPFATLSAIHASAKSSDPWPPTLPAERAMPGHFR